MSTLSKRATPAQKRMLRIIEGSVKQAYAAHQKKIDIDRFARSVAKRAVGTLSAQLPLSERFAGGSLPVMEGEAAISTAPPLVG